MFILDLPNLTTICYVGCGKNYSPALQGDYNCNRMKTINENQSYNNTLIMKGK